MLDTPANKNIFEMDLRKLNAYLIRSAAANSNNDMTNTSSVLAQKNYENSVSSNENNFKNTAPINFITAEDSENVSSSQPLASNTNPQQQTNSKLTYEYESEGSDTSKRIEKEIIEYISRVSLNKKYATLIKFN